MTTPTHTPWLSIKAADARLIAAAPDMLEALQLLLETIAPTPIKHEVSNRPNGAGMFNVRFADIAKARAALSKALGEDGQ